MPVSRWVAIALTGRVAGLSLLFAHGAETWFAAGAHDSLFRVGANEVEPFVVEGPVGDEVLRPVEVVGS